MGRRGTPNPPPTPTPTPPPIHPPTPPAHPPAHPPPPPAPPPPQVNVFSLGAVYVQLLRLLRLEDHPTFAAPSDPSLFLSRFCDKLKLGPPEPNGDPCPMSRAVNTTATRLISAMKRDWMQTGRRPSGVCGAALFLACHIHGVARSKHDIMRVVHVGWSTLDERVREFRNTPVSAMTAAEFEAAAAAAVEDERQLMLEMVRAAARGGEARGRWGRRVRACAEGCLAGRGLEPCRRR